MKITVKVSLIIIFLTYFYSPVQVWAKTFYLDGNLANSCVGSTYSTANRNCAGTDGQGYKTLAEAINSLVGSDTLFIRSGTYARTTNDLWSGSLGIGASGTPAQHTVVRAYPNEQPVICTEVGRCQYNPNPGDTSVNNCYTPGSEGGAACYYPNPAISVGGQYIDVIGLKTYGQLLIGPSDNILIEGNDLGGGGPHINQGAVVIMDCFGSCFNITVRNNQIHHSAWGESDGNGPGVLTYGASYVLENNEFYDNWHGDIKYKTTDGQVGRTIIIRNNFFRPSTIYKNAGAGIVGHSSGRYVDYVEIHNNIFLNKQIAQQWEQPAVIATTIFNNTFINCAMDVFEWLASPPINSFNNLFYHSNSGHRYYYFEDGNYALSALSSNWNNFFSTGSAAGNTRWTHGNPSYTTLSAWQSATGKDANSIASNPNFINAAGNRPEHFKRTSYPNEVSGSKYAAVAGAYVTGNEQIGVQIGVSRALPPVTAPLPPTALTVH